MKRALLLVGIAGLTASCAGWTRWPWGTTQRWPSAMETASDPLPSGQAHLYEEGPEEVLVLRHADPVKVRPTGFSAGYPLTFYRKSVRVHAGSEVSCAPGGRIEVIWNNGNSIVLYDGGTGVVGSPTRGESSFVFFTCERARIELKEPDEIGLMSGARLSASTGPFVLERVRQDVLRVSNQSKGTGEVLFRDAVVRLDPGQMVDLPLLSAGGTPIPGDLTQKSIEGQGFSVSWSGSVDAARDGGAVKVRALGEHEVRSLGVRVRLERDETARFEGLGGPRPQGGP